MPNTFCHLQRADFSWYTRTPDCPSAGCDIDIQDDRLSCLGENEGNFTGAQHLLWHVMVCRKLVSLTAANVKARGGVRNKSDIAADHSEKLSAPCQYAAPEAVPALSRDGQEAWRFSGGKKKCSCGQWHVFQQLHPEVTCSCCSDLSSRHSYSHEEKVSQERFCQHSWIISCDGLTSPQQSCKSHQCPVWRTCGDVPVLIQCILSSHGAWLCPVLMIQIVHVLSSHKPKYFKRQRPLLCKGDFPSVHLPNYFSPPSPPDWT